MARSNFLMTRKKVLKIKVLKEVQEDASGDPFANIVKKKRKKKQSSWEISLKLINYNDHSKSSRIEILKLFSSDDSDQEPSVKARNRWKRGGKLAVSGQAKIKAAAKKEKKKVWWKGLTIFCVWFKFSALKIFFLISF